MRSDTNATRLHHLLARQAALRPAAPAVWWRGEETSYADLFRNVCALAAGIAAQSEPGARIALLGWNSARFLELLYAIPAAGCIAVPLNARLAPAELCYQLRHAGVSLLLAVPDLAGPLLAHEEFPEDLLVQVGDDDWPALYRHGGSVPDLDEQHAAPAWLLYTSGSTGRPKGALLTHSSLLAGLDSGAQGRPVLPDDKYLYPFPLFHVAAHNTLLQHQYGACVVLLAGFNAEEALACMGSPGVTTMSLAPTMIAMLFDHPDFDAGKLRQVRTIGYGAAPIPQGLMARLVDETEVELSQGYGMTELSGSVAFLGDEDHRRAYRDGLPILASVGKPVAGVDICLRDDGGKPVAVGERGEITVRAAQHLREYWQQPEATAEGIRGGWFYTGDVGRFDESGYLYIVDRKKDMIISGGENVASREVEEVLRLHPAVADAAVIGVPDERWGERVAAVLTLRAEAGESELEAHCRGLLAGYKTPRQYFVVDELPVNANGKVDKPALRRRFGA